MIRRPPRSTLDRSSAASDVYKRQPHNPNLLVWDRRPWLIDHGAALYAHHDWASVDDARTVTSFPLIRSHVLLPVAGDLAAADAVCAARLTADVIADVVDAVPDDLY